MDKKKRVKSSDIRESIRINIEISGEPAEWLLAWKARGLVTSNKDAVLRAFRVLQEKIIEQDLRVARLGMFERGEE